MYDDGDLRNAIVVIGKRRPGAFGGVPHIFTSVLLLKDKDNNERQMLNTAFNYRYLSFLVCVSIC